MKLKPNRAELLDAICARLGEKAEEARAKVSDIVHKIRRKRDQLKEKRGQKQLKIEQFDEAVADIQATLNKVLTKHGFCEIDRVTTEAHDFGADKVQPKLRFHGAPARKPYRKSPTKVLDRKIEELDQQLSDLSQQEQVLSRKARFWAPGDRWERREQRKERHNAVIEQLLASDSGLIKQIDQAASALGGDIEEVVATVEAQPVKV